MSMLALDLALTTGVALVCDESRVNTFTWDLRSDDDPTPATDRSIAPALRLTNKLDETHNVWDLSIVIFESAHTRQSRSAWIQNSLQTATMLWCHRHGVKFSRWRPSEWKLAMLGKGFGNCSREVYHHEARKRWPDLDLQTDDEAAARWLLEMELR